jgi:hypothetical protein
VTVQRCRVAVKVTWGAGQKDAQAGPGVLGLTLEKKRCLGVQGAMT